MANNLVVWKKAISLMVDALFLTCPRMVPGNLRHCSLFLLIVNTRHVVS
jgi:hypothetical protein